jgi:hypothetical protein
MGLKRRGLAQGVVEVAQVELSEAEREGERKLAVAIFGPEGRKGRAQAR